MEIITVECMNPRPHKAHSWREGFLWHRKRECGGVPQRHKHKYVLQNHMTFIDPLKLVWHCDCGKFCSMYREEFRKALNDPNMIPIRAN
ncbi:hypothetical protein PBI_INGRID_77 [Arthrobacter phage Ingrid]|nr:hypothetical protein PBI_INGRID_77 [Arthrobacter phage Ingrid]QFG11054.1 hypothetical protein PBI_LORETTA_73 [Arthrobacter phage Loretta]